MKLGNIELKSPFILAPMAGVTDQAYRKIALNMGASLVITDMISDKGLLFENKKTLDMIKIDDDEHPIGLQLFGSEPDTLLAASKLVLKHEKPDFIDLNMGCPMKKIVANGSGSALLKDPDKIYSIVKTLTDNLDIPISCKIRSGWDHNSINCDKVAKMIEKAGGSFITIHGRCRSDFYTGSVNLDHIKMVRDSVNIPIIGNGDIIDYNSYLKMKELGVDAVMIGRAALGNPWIFRMLNEELNNQMITPLTKDEVLDMILLHASSLMKIKNESTAMIEMRTHGGWYLKQLMNTKPYKVMITKVTTYQELLNIVSEIRSNPKIYIK